MNQALSLFKVVSGHIIGTDIGIGGYKDSQIGLCIDVEIDEDRESRYRFFDGVFLADKLESLDPLALRQYAGILAKLHSMLEITGSDSLIDLVGLAVEVRIAGNKAVAFRFPDSNVPWPNGYS